MKNSGLYKIGVIVLAVTIVAVAVLLLTSGPRGVEPQAPPPAVAESSAQEVAFPNGSLKTPPSAGPGETVIEMPVQEIRKLPENVTIPARQISSTVTEADIPSGDHRLSGVHEVLPKDQNGPFLAPRLSPDGLQMIVTRTGYKGIYVVPVQGGKPVQIADANAFKAKWTPDGKIEVIDKQGNRSLYGADGTLESTQPYDPKQQRVYAENDTVYVRPSPDQPPVPITSGDDRYYGPTLSPDGKYVVYQGLYTGIYVAPTDGSHSPRYLGEGNAPVWLPDSSGVVFDVTRDDGMNLTSGNLYYADANGHERTNLTNGNDGIAITPSVGPDGRTITWESNGSIYSGTLR